jgi:hypothetical protein
MREAVMWLGLCGLAVGCHLLVLHDRRHTLRLQTLSALDANKHLILALLFHSVGDLPAGNREWHIAARHMIHTRNLGLGSVSSHN